MVQPDDVCYLLGDFTCGSQSGSLKMSKSLAYCHYRNQIRCKNIFYIRGNHSLSKDKLKELNIFTKIYDYYELSYKRQLVCMFHYPIHSWNGMSKHSYHFFGHEHRGRVRGRSMDIGLDGNNFKPYKLDDVIEFLSTQPILTEGHHE